MANFEKVEKYLEKLKHEMEVWQNKVDELPEDSISTNHPYYRMSVNASNKYATASYMLKLIKDEI